MNEIMEACVEIAENEKAAESLYENMSWVIEKIETAGYTYEEAFAMAKDYYRRKYESRN